MAVVDHTLILGLETSCDETSASIVADGKQILSNIISSQIDVHQQYGGVVPELASRKHTENVMLVIDMALKQAGITLRQLNAIAVTYGPGLVGALLVGVSAAKALSYGCGLPLLAVNHLEGHLYANFLEHPQLKPPFVSLVVSGGHTSLLLVKGHGCYEILGRTRDDAAGEAFDKVARVMGLGYPGGPLIDQLAEQGDREAIAFPRALIHEGFDFSFSGLKSSVLNYLHHQQQCQSTVRLADVAASFQWAIVDILVQKTIHAAQQTGVQQIALAGGVAANNGLRQHLATAAGQAGLELFYPSPVLCTDNAAMIACRGYYQYMDHTFAELSLNAVSSMSLMPGYEQG